MTNTSSPALRTALSPRYGVMSIHRAEDGFEALPLDPTPAAREGLLALHAPDLPSILAWVREW